VSSRASRVRASPWLFRAYLAVGIAAVGLYQLAHGPAAVALYGAIGLFGVLGSLAASLRHRWRTAWPRLLITGGLALLVAGDLAWYIEDLLGHTIPIPSASDALYLCGYPILAAGLIFMQRRRGVANLIDAVIVTVALATVIWSPLFAMFRASAGHPLGERFTLGAYPVWDLLLFLFAARFALGRALRPPWRAVLALGIAVLFVGDLMWAASADTYALGNWVDRTWLLAYVLIGASGLHRSAIDSREADAGYETLARRRFLVLVVPVTVLPVAFTVEALSGRAPTIVDAFLTSGLLVLLLVRLGGVIRGLDASQSRFRKLFADAPAGMAILSPDGRVLSANAALCAVMRAPEQDLVGRNYLDWVGADDRAEHSEVFESVSEGADAEVGERRFRAADGTEVWALFTVSHVGEALVVHVQDVTEARRLRRQLAERNAELERADRLKDELISVVSHDLRTPLTSIMGYLELAIDDDGTGELSGERRDYLDVAVRNAERLRKLVDDLLFVSRVKAGKAGLALEELDVGRIARDSVENALPAASAAGVTLASSCDADVMALVDSHRVAEAVENLLSNALKFTPAGGRIDVRVTGNESDVSIRVSDTGVGISDEDIAHLFDRFYRTADAATVPGAGLGLSIVKAIADAHDGSIEVTSRPGAGTTFSLRLPRAASIPARVGVPA
jgi:PAS domain S-box-containing protein